MNEIARIHLAKVPYDIELSAKKELEAYILALQQYAGDAELMQDIEIRITELLHARGVAQNGIISEADVAAIRQQLGEPEDFADEDAKPKQTAAVDTGAGRTLYRDVDHAVLGGVLSGIAGFFRINPLWLRLAFIVLLIASFGTALLVYILLWIIVPPARTAAEKLQLAGKPVTLSSIRELSEQEELTPPDRSRPELLQRIIFFTLGTISLFGALGALILTVVAIVAGIAQPRELDAYLQLMDGWAYWGALSLFVMSGLLLTALFSLGAYAAFARKTTKKLAITAASIILAGILTFGAGLSLAAYQSWTVHEEAQKALVKTQPQLPAEFNQATHLVVTLNESHDLPLDLASTSFEYIADRPARASLSAMPGDKPEITMDGTTAYVTFEPNGNDKRYAFTQPSLKLYGPQLQKLTVHEGSVTYTVDVQEALEIEADDDSSVSLAGTFSNVTARADDNASVFLGNASIQHLIVTTSQYGNVTAGTVRTLKVTQPDACPSGTPLSRVQVQDINSETYEHNGAVRQIGTYVTPCGKVVVGDEYDYREY